MTRIPRTAAPRSAVVHAVRLTDARPDQYSHGTVCGRQIGDDWAGEYTEEPSGPVTCKRCNSIMGTPVAAPRVAAAILANPAVTDARVIDDAQEAVSYDHANPVHRAEKIRNARLDSAFTTGQRVGILTGLQSARGAWIGSYGTVTASREFWHGKLSYLVRADGESESFVYEAWQLTDDVTLDPRTLPLQRCEAPDHGHLCGMPVRSRSMSPRCERHAAMDRHPAGKARTLRDHRIDSERAADGSERPPASVIDAFTRRGYTVRRAARVRFGWLVMAYRPHGLKDNGTYTYVVGSIGEADREWCAGHYSINPGTADANFRERLS